MMSDLWRQLVTNPWVLAYVLGIVTGWNLSRRTTRYLLGGTFSK
jgi:hypothetical protein